LARPRDGGGDVRFDDIEHRELGADFIGAVLLRRIKMVYGRIDAIHTEILLASHWQLIG